MRVLLFLCCCVASSTLLAEQVKFTAAIDGEQIKITRDGFDGPTIMQVAKNDFRPYLHPIMPPDGKGVLTQYSPGHHKHQTGLYWGFTRVNGRDYFHHPGDNYWKLREKKVLKEIGRQVQWRTVYDLLDGQQEPILTETQTWTLSESEGAFQLDLIWQGTAVGEVTFAKYAYGGLFLRMPWTRQNGGEAVNSEGKKNGAAEGQRARWIDTGMPIAGREDWGHVVIMDHPKNDGHPTPWRVDGQLGVGPCRARLGEWKLEDGETATFRHRLLIYTGETDTDRVEASYKQFAGE